MPQPAGLVIPFARPVTIPEAAIPHPPPDDLLLPASTRRGAWADIGLLLVCLLLFEAGIQLIVGSAAGLEHGSGNADSPADYGELERTMLFPVLTVRALLSVAVVGLILRRRGQSVRSIGLKRGGIVLDFPIGLAAAAVAYGLTCLAFLLLWMGGVRIAEQMAENAEHILEIMPRLSLTGFVGLSVMIGVYEELVFRGFLMVRLRRALGGWTPAILVSGAFFTALHALEQVTVALVAVGILALIFSVTTIWRRSIVPAIVAHTLWNLVQFLNLYFYSGVGET